MDARVASRPITSSHQTSTPEGSRWRIRGKRNDARNPAHQIAAAGRLLPGAGQLCVWSDGGRGGTAGPTGPSRDGAGLVLAPVLAGREPRHANHLRERRTGVSKPAG